MSRSYAPAYRKWCATFQNPDPEWHNPKENFVKAMLTMVGDIHNIVWSYEMGDKPVGENNPAYVEGEATGGNLHYQIYFETKNQYRQSAMKNHLEGFWVEWSYAPKSAKNYACKADHTLIAGPWEWTDGTGGQGKRNDITEVAGLIRKGKKYTEVRNSGEYDNQCARYKGYMMELQVSLDRGKEDIKYPIIKWDEVMHKPDPKVKKRHWWVVGKADMGKTQMIGEMFGEQKVFYIGSDVEYRWEGYEDEEIIIYDDCKLGFSEIACVTNTVPFPVHVPGKTRYVGMSFRRNSSRNVIVLSNHTWNDRGYSEEHKEAIKARFILVDLRSGGGMFPQAQAPASEASRDDASNGEWEVMPNGEIVNNAPQAEGELDEDN